MVCTIGGAMDDTTDSRHQTYRDFQDRQHELELPHLKLAAHRVLRILFEHIPRAKSVLDVGCGLGAWLAAAQQMGMTDLRGIDGPWLDRGRLIIEPERVEILDLEKPFSLGRRYDLVLCIEVAEHLSEASAESFIGSLAAHSELILFSAAIPYQGGHHHVNERFPDYWAKLFAAQAFVPFDLFRARLWVDSKVPVYLRQNLLLFVHQAAVTRYPSLTPYRAGAHPLSIVHPELFFRAAKDAYESRTLTQLLSQPGRYRVERAADGGLTVERVNSADPGAWT